MTLLQCRGDQFLASMTSYLEPLTLLKEIKTTYLSFIRYYNHPYDCFIFGFYTVSKFLYEITKNYTLDETFKEFLMENNICEILSQEYADLLKKQILLRHKNFQFQNISTT